MAILPAKTPQTRPLSKVLAVPLLQRHLGGDGVTGRLPSTLEAALARKAGAFRACPRHWEDPCAAARSIERVVCIC